ncbi:hypothetical protein [Streptomyces sp. NPDC056663]|uniref:hypothetical protein n=1 Tax=Streptomyces sp. NPDC056663 TaxID=3345899 RepID=UPI003692B485
MQEERPDLVGGEVHSAAQGTRTSGLRAEHGIAHLKKWRALTRHLGRRELLDELVPAITGLTSTHRQLPQPAAVG